MNPSKLIGKWMLTSAPFKCRPKILNGIIIDFCENGQAFVSDTANYADCTFNENNKTINIECSGWT